MLETLCYHPYCTHFYRRFCHIFRWSNEVLITMTLHTAFNHLCGKKQNGNNMNNWVPLEDLLYCLSLLWLWSTHCGNNCNINTVCYYYYFLNYKFQWFLQYIFAEMRFKTLNVTLLFYFTVLMGQMILSLDLVGLKHNFSGIYRCHIHQL